MVIPSQSYFIFFLSLIFNVLASSPALQRNALLEFKNEFPVNAPYASEAPSYTSLSSWNTSSSDHCSWKGVTCNANNSGEEVISLVLENTFLNGSLKENTSLLKLQNLQHLTLSSCNLRGAIPSSLGNLTRLKHLDISSNHDLAGEIPSSIGNLFHLIFFSLHNNSLVGRLPSSLGNLSRLTNLDLSENHLIGEVPTSIFTILSLQEVSLSGNQFEGPLEFGNKTSSSYELSWLDLASNNFYRPIPEYISLFLKLKYLRLSHNSFIGTIPFSISKLASLKFLYLSYNNLEGQVPSFLWRLSILRLSHNSFTSLDESSSNSLQVSVFLIDLGSNSLRGSFPRWLCNCTLLYCLDLSNNHLTGSIPSCMTNCAASFRDINLRNNSLSGFLPDIFNNATSLQLLDVSHNQLTGKLPKSLINCKSMEYLNLKGNKIKDTFPSWLRYLVSLRVLFLGSNAFYGPVSSRFGFPSLRVIDISHNNFNGTLPRDYFVNWHEMSSVVLVEKMQWYEVTMHKGSPYYRDLMDMMYKGVHTQFPRIFIAFKAIDFSGNRFTGRIPESVGMLKALVHVNFSRNGFTGSIPSSLANLTNLEALDLSRNKLSGNIPSDLANLSFMSYLDFSHNFLQGPVPRSTQFQRQRCSSFENNLGLFGLEEICGEIYAPDPTSGDSQKSVESSSQESDEVLLNRIAVAIAFGPGVFCGLMIGHIFFTSQKHKWFIEKFGRNYSPVGIITVR